MEQTLLAFLIGICAGLLVGAYCEAKYGRRRVRWISKEEWTERHPEDPHPWLDE